MDITHHLLKRCGFERLLRFSVLAHRVNASILHKPAQKPLHRVDATLCVFRSVRLNLRHSAA